MASHDDVSSPSDSSDAREPTNRATSVSDDAIVRAAGELRAPLRWMSLPRATDLPADVCAALRVDPLPGWDWMSTTTIGDVPGTERVERLDLAADLPAILDCLRETPHPSHFHLAESLEAIALLKPRRAVLTNLHVDLDYRSLSNRLPDDIEVAFDGMVIRAKG